MVLSVHEGEVNGEVNIRPRDGGFSSRLALKGSGFAHVTAGLRSTGKNECLPRTLK